MSEPRPSALLSHRAISSFVERMTVCALVAATWCWLSAAAPAQETQKPTSGMQARREAASAIPFDRLTDEQKQNVAAVLRKTSVYRRMPTATIRTDAEFYQFILNHPEILANIWQIMEVENVVLRATGENTYIADDGDGTRGEVEFLYRDNDLCLVFARGTYDGPLFTQPITGTAVLLLRSKYARGEDGRSYVTTQLDAFVHLDNVGLDFLAKTFQPLVCRVADYNFLVTASFIESLARTAEVNGMGMQRLAANLQNLDPQVRRDFAKLAAEVNARAMGRRESSRELARLPERQAGSEVIISD